MVRRILPLVRQYETHRQLAGRARPGNWHAGRTDLDAIIVPASRTADNLDHAVSLAQAAECWLVVLCSRETRATDVGQLFTDKRFTKGVAVDISDDYCHPLLAFSSSDLARASESPVCVNPNGDLSTKRNLGLLLARMLGWSRIFFMDDDVRGVSLTDLRVTVSMLDRYRSVGMRVTDYADNSVVCHAYRATGANQDVFVSGSVLAVNCQQPFGFFPEIYNEDWLFFYDDARAGQLGWSGRDVTQLPYDPFEDGRAECQEFGDVLAEGLYALLHIRSGVTDATVGYWNRFMWTRKNVLEQIIGRADSVAPEIGQNIVRAVQTAMLRLMQIQPKAFEDYIKAWRDDLRVWAERLETVPRAGSMEEALEVLVLGSAQRGHPTVHEPVGTMPALQVILDAADFVVYLMVSNLRYGRTAPVFARVRRWIQRTDPREAISSMPQAPNAQLELALAQDPALAVAPVRVPSRPYESRGNRQTSLATPLDGGA